MGNVIAIFNQAITHTENAPTLSMAHKQTDIRTTILGHSILNSIKMQLSHELLPHFPRKLSLGSF